jgi:hypothetical protein
MSELSLTYFANLHPAQHSLAIGTPVCKVTMPYSLTPAFATSWRNLQTELKLAVLANILLQDTALEVFWLSEDSCRRHRSRTRRPVGTLNFWFFLEHAEFADLAFDLFFKQNVFSVSTDFFHMSRCCPEPYIADYIQRIEVHIMCVPADWTWLTQFVNGRFGYRNLRSVMPRVHGPSSYLNDFDLFVDLIIASDPLALAVESLDLRYCRLDCEEDTREVDVNALEELIGAHVVRREDVLLL